MPNRCPERRPRLRGVLTALGLCWLLAPAQPEALPEDREQPIHITADQALRDEKQGVTVYSGNVMLTQGTLKIRAEKLTIFHAGPDLDRVVAQGSPAYMEQQPDPEKGLVKARAGEITYYQAEDRIHLQHEAQIEREGNIVNSNSIDYFIDDERVQARSSGDSSERVHMVIPPQSIAREKEDSGATDSE